MPSTILLLSLVPFCNQASRLPEEASQLINLYLISCLVVRFLHCGFKQGNVSASLRQLQPSAGGSIGGLLGTITIPVSLWKVVMSKL